MMSTGIKEQVPKESSQPSATMPVFHLAGLK